MEPVKADGKHAALEPEMPAEEDGEEGQRRNKNSSYEKEKTQS